MKFKGSSILLAFVGLTVPFRGHADRIDVDFFLATNGFPGMYRSEYLVGPSTLHFDKLTANLEAFIDRSVQPTPVVNETLVLDVLVFPSHHQDSCAGFKDSLPQCLNYDILLQHGVGLPGDGPPHSRQSYALCCTDELVAQGKCRNTKTLIVDSDTFDGQHLQLTIPVGETFVPRAQLSRASVKVAQSGRFFVAISTCSVDSIDPSLNSGNLGNVYLFGKLMWKTALGYLELSMMGIFVVFILQLVAYATATLWYGRMVLQKTTTRRPSETWICVVLAVGLGEAFFYVLSLGMQDADGQDWMSLFMASIVLNSVKMTASLYLGMFLAQARGMPFPVEGPALQHERALRSNLPLKAGVGLYGILTLIYGCTGVAILNVWVTNSHWNFDYVEALSFVMVFSHFLAAMVGVGMLVWMTVATSRTIQYLRDIQTERANVLRYVRLRYVFLLSTVASVASLGTAIMALPFVTKYYFVLAFVSWTDYIMIPQNMIFFITLLAIAFLWRPQANELEDAHLTALLLNAPVEGDDDLDIVEMPVAAGEEQHEEDRHDADPVIGDESTTESAAADFTDVGHHRVV